MYGILFLVHHTVRAQPYIEHTETLYFKSGVYTLDGRETKKLLNILTDTVNLNSMVEISGYTDSIGTFQANMQLSTKRSESVVEFLTGYSRHIKYRVKNFGEMNPVSVKDISLNRRVEIRFQKR